ncbi:MAG: hypothetical protein AAB460_02610 [Patescibacteria group bacterium]
MTPEALRQSRLEIEHRNPLQVEIMKRMLGDRISNQQAQLAWALENGKRISDIIDNSGGQELRDIARAGRYAEAADRVIWGMVH